MFPKAVVSLRYRAMEYILSLNEDAPYNSILFDSEFVFRLIDAICERSELDKKKETFVKGGWHLC